MPIELKMPALSPTMEEGTLAKWLVKEGDSVAAGDLLAEIETDKATMEFEAVDEGTIAKILVAEGTDEVKVGTVIALIASEGEDAGAAAAVPKAAKEPVAKDAGETKPWVVNDSLQIASVMSATGSFDHRAIDGAVGAELMKRFKELVESPLGMIA